MSNCPECGNEVQEGNRFCANCGNSLTTSASRLADRSGLQAVLSLPGAHQWGLLVLVIGGLLGYIGLLVNWSVSLNVWDYLYFGFGNENVPWWTGVIALGAITGVAVNILNVVTAVRRRALPSNRRLLLSGILIALCPIGAHIGYVASDATPWGQNAGAFWYYVWLLESAGLWISLTGGILVILATAIGGLLSSLKF